MIPLVRGIRSLLLAMIIAAVAVNYLWGVALALPLWLAIVVAAFVFRNPLRHVPASPLGVVGPIDGVVDNVRRGEDKFLQRPSTVIRIQQRLLSALVCRYPVEGKIIKSWYPSTSYPEGHKVALAVQIRTDEDDNVVTAFGAARFGLLSFHCQPGRRVAQGRQGGYTGFGRWVDIYLPTTSTINIQSGKALKAGEDIIATLVHE